MKKITLIFMLSVLFGTVSGQINIGPNELARKNAGDFNKEHLEKLKDTKSLFIYREVDEDILDDFSEALKDAWDYTTLELISYKDFKEKREDYTEGYSFFTIGVKQTKKISDGRTTYFTHVYLKLWMEIKGNIRSFCRIELHPAMEVYLRAQGALEKKSRENKLMNYLYDDAVLHNWNTVHLRNSLQFVNSQIKESAEHWLFSSEAYDKLSELKNATLYIPDHVMIATKPFSGDESKLHNEKKLFKKYAYKYKVVSLEELQDIIEDTGDPVYYLSYVSSNTDKFISVWNAKTGEVLYTKYIPVSYNIKDKDLAKLSKAIGG